MVLLTAPRQVQVERLGTRTGNDFGKQPAELAKVLADTDQIDSLLRRGPGLVVDTSRPLADVVADVLAFLR
ncbi:MAG: hypothetical protein JWN77_3225 [Frankiales bacterium]|nr:hypothetical protein [Frankiales bacterium]